MALGTRHQHPVWHWGPTRALGTGHQEWLWHWGQGSSTQYGTGDRAQDTQCGTGDSVWHWEQDSDTGDTSLALGTGHWSPSLALGWGHWG